MSVEAMEINRSEHGGNIYRVSEETGIPATEQIGRASCRERV